MSSALTLGTIQYRAAPKTSALEEIHPDPLYLKLFEENKNHLLLQIHSTHLVYSPRNKAVGNSKHDKLLFCEPGMITNSDIHVRWIFHSFCFTGVSPPYPFLPAKPSWCRRDAKLHQPYNQFMELKS